MTAPAPTPTTTDVADAIVDLARLTLALGRVDRTACYHPDGVTKESDTDHSMMLVFVACSLAYRFWPHLDVGLIAQFAAVHDAVEVYAGDTPTLRITPAGRAAKAAREQAAADRIDAEFTGRLDWLPDLIALYEAQNLPEARLVKWADKILPKAVHLLDGAAGLVEHGMTLASLADVFTAQAAAMESAVSDLPELLDIRAELVGRTVDLLGRVTAGR